MANTYLTISLVTKEALRVLENNLVLFPFVNRDFDEKFGVDGAKVGDVVNARKPPKYVGRLGRQMVVEDATETSVPIRLDTQFGVDLEFYASDLALSIDDFSNRFLKPAVSVIASKVDGDIAALYDQIWNCVGTPGTIPTALLTYLLAGVKLDDGQTPQDELRGMFITPLMQAYIVDALKGLFQQAAAIGEQYTKGLMGVAVGFTWKMTQQLYSHTVGTYAGTPLVNGGNQVGSSLITDGWSSGASTLKRGDIFTIANVNRVNATTRRSVGQLQQFRVVDDISDTTGAMTITIDPEIIISGPFQTVDAAPADNAPITVNGASGTVTPQGLALHRDAITLVCADLPLPEGEDRAARMSDEQLGLSIRMVRGYTIREDAFLCRLDILYGVAMLRPELACRVAS